MENKIFKNWWTYTVKGVFAIAFGLVALFVPNASQEWLILLFSGFIILSGLFLVGGSISQMKHNKKWSMWMFEGLLDIVLGIIMIVYHQMKADFELFIIFVGIWAVTVGFTQLFAAMSTNKTVRTRWLLLINALIVIVAGFVLFYNPFEGPEDTMNMIGIFAIVFGAFISIYSFGLKGH
jgi:uncharacterized membrane protein HdeD (DUF308 family)